MFIVMPGGYRIFDVPVDVAVSNPDFAGRVFGVGLNKLKYTRFGAGYIHGEITGEAEIGGNGGAEARDHVDEGGGGKGNCRSIAGTRNPC
jgi:hypothetical protein